MLKLVFLGMNSSYSILPLLAVMDQCEVSLVFELVQNTRPGIKENVKKLIGYSSSGAYILKKSAGVYGFEYCAGDNVNGEKLKKRISDIAPDLILVSGFSQTLDSELLSIPRSGCINIHSGPLPVYRGANPFFTLSVKILRMAV